MDEITLEESVRMLFKAWEFSGRKMGREVLPLFDGIGRILAEDLTAPMDQPPFSRSPIDGYAVRAADTKGASRDNPSVLMVAGQVMAGEYPKMAAAPGTAIRIMTGAPIPSGADCTVRQEDTDYGEDRVCIYREHKIHDNVCDQGEDYREGDCLLKKGEKLDAVSIGIAASMGYDKVPVFEKPKIALFTTGDEVVPPGVQLKPGKIYNSNLYVAGCRLRELANQPVQTGAVKDSPEDMAWRLKEAGTFADLIITTGGVSVGKKDIMHDALRELGAERLFWKINCKPGSPVIGSVFHKTIIISLSGNPFGAIANLELLVRPVLAKMSQDNTLCPRPVQAVMAGEYKKASPGRRFLRAVYENGRVTLPEGLHSSGVLGSMKGCNCFIDIEAGSRGLKKGDQVRAVLL